MEDQVGRKLASVAQLRTGPSRDQRQREACRGKRLGAGKHVPDRLGELARDLDAGDLGAALAAEAFLGGLVVQRVGGMAGGVHGGLDQGPAEGLGAVLGKRPAAVASARLVDQRAEAGVADELPGRGEALEQLSSAQAEEVADRAAEAVRDQGGVDALLEGRAVTHQVEAEARALGARPGLGSQIRQIAGTRSRRASSASS